MNDRTLVAPPSSTWLKGYYFTRFAVSAVWVILAFTIGRSHPPLAAAMLITYPLWDALANLADARRNGRFGSNKTQMLNFVGSLLTAAAVAIALGRGMNAVLAVFGIWAVFAGLLQLATAVRRRKSTGAQWAMILSGFQSALAGLFFIKMASGPAVASIIDVAPYAAFGAFYFFVSAIWLTLADIRRGPVRSI